MTRMLGYARTTSPDRRRLALQHDALAAVGCEHIFTDTIPTPTAPQPQLDVALAALARGDLLVVWSLDRLVRSLPQLLKTTTQILDAEAGLWTISEDINTTDPDAGAQAVKLIRGLSKCQHELIRENTLVGLAAARRRGRVGGRPRALSDIAVAQARTMKAGGATTAEIAQVLGVGRSTIHRYLA